MIVANAVTVQGCEGAKPQARARLFSSVHVAEPNE